MYLKKSLLVLVPALLLLGACSGDPVSSSGGSTDSSASISSSSDISISSSSEETSSSQVIDSSEDSSSIEEVDPYEEFSAALEADYSDYITYYSDSLIEYPVNIYHVDGWDIVDDNYYTAMYGERSYLFYHDYEGENYLYFEEEDPERGDAWLKEGYHNAPLSIQYTYLDLEFLVTGLDVNDVVYGLEGNPLYYVTDEEAVNTLNSDFFMASIIWELPAAYYAITVEDGYISSIIGFTEYGQSSDYFSLALMSVNETAIPSDATLPPLPSEENVKTYAEYKGEEPWVETHIESINLATAIEGASLTLSYDDTLDLTYSFLPETANTYLISGYSSNEEVVTMERNYDGGYTVTPVRAGSADVYLVDDETSIASNHLTITVTADEGSITDTAFADVTFSTLNSNGTIATNNRVSGGPAIAASTSYSGNISVGTASTSTDNGDIDLFSTGVSFRPGYNWNSTDGVTESTLILDAGEGNSISSLAFNYGLIFASHRGNLDYYNENVKYYATILYSDDGETFEEASDWTTEFVAKASSDHYRLKEHTFESAHRYIMISFDTDYIGKEVWVYVPSVTLY